MFNPFLLDKLAKIENAERLKEAREHRAARMARGEAKQPSASWPMIALTAATGVISLLLLVGVR